VGFTRLVADALPVDERPLDHTPIATADLPPTPLRDRSIPPTAWSDAPDRLLTLGDDIGAPITRYLRRIDNWLLWRAGRAVGADARYLAIDADDLSVQYEFRLYPDKSGVGLGPSGETQTTFRNWKLDLKHG
jgi:hypothetical protein